MNLDEIQALWDEDSKLDQDELHVESTKIPSLHAKYYKIYNNLTLLKKVEEIKMKQAKKEKCDAVWSMPRKSALPAYEKFGFVKQGDFFDEGVEFGPNCWVLKRL